MMKHFLAALIPFIAPVPLLAGDVPSALKASMIWSADIAPGTQAYVAFRAGIMLDEAPKSAPLHLFADSRYLLWVNGRHVLRGPSRFHPDRPEYDTLDIAPFLHPGRNSIVALVHHYAGATSGRIIRHAPGVGAVLEADGREILRTGAGWKSSARTEYQPSPSAWSSIPDVIDGREWPGDWTATDFDDATWKSSLLIDGSSWGAFHPRTTPLCQESDISGLCILPERKLLADGLPIELRPGGDNLTGFHPLSATNIHPNHQGPSAGTDAVVLDLGRMAMAYPTVDLEADEGSVLQIEYALRFVDGKPAERYGVGTTYTARAGRQTFVAADQWCARYVTLRCLSGRVRLLGFKMTDRRYPYERIGRFECSDPLLTRLWEMAVHTVEVTTDDAHGSDARERNEWVQDGSKASFQTMRVASAGPDRGDGRCQPDCRTLRKLLIDAAVCQMPDGRLPGTFPTDRGAEDPHHFIEDYALQWIESLRWHHELTGDAAFSREMWPVLVRQMQWFLDRRTPRGLLLAREYTSFDNPIAYLTCEGATINAFFHKALCDAAWIARQIGKADQAAAYAEAALALAKTFDASLWDERAQAYSAGFLDGEKLPPSVHAQLMALYSGLVPAGRLAATRSYFLANFRNPGAGAVVGLKGNYRELLAGRAGLGMPIMFYWAFTELYRMDTREADHLAMEETRRRWSNMVRFLEDAGTLSESFVDDQGGGMSESCHNYGSVPAYFLSSYLLGVRVDEPVSEKRLVINPRPAGIASASGVVLTPFGGVPIRWEIKDGTWHLAFTVPDGVEAELRLPDVEAGTLVVNGVAGAGGSIKGRNTILSVGPGNVVVQAKTKVSAVPAAPAGLLTNGIRDPQAVDVAPPAFSWIMNDPDRGEVQSAYQIVVTAEGKVLWDSGKVPSAASSSVPYAGPPLAPATRHAWKVKQWDKDGNESPFSAEAAFDTGITTSDWTAAFIWDGTTNENNFAHFRKGFTLDKPVRMAKLFVTGHNDYLLHLNGTQLGFGPARSNPTTYGQYVGYDVTTLLQPGRNAFAAEAHWHGVWNDSGTNASPAFRLECRILFADGTTQTLATDDSWKTRADTPFIESEPQYFGFAGGVRNRAALRYDARREINSWKLADFDDSAWTNATVVDRSSYRLFAQRVANQTEEQELAPVSCSPSGDRWVADFGKCLSGWPQITLRNQTPGAVVRIEYFQMADGSGPAGWDEYTCRGGVETWRANFGRHTTFKTLRISGVTGPLAADDIRAVVAHTAAEVAGSFTCSNTLLNDIHEMSERSARQNVQQGIISVDANREQSPWTADSHNIGIGLLYHHRNTLILDKILRDYAGEQMPDGRFWACSPSPIYEIPEWSMHWPLMLWQQYLFTGDSRLLSDLWPNLVKWMAWAETNTKESGLLDAPGWRIADYAGGIMENDGENIALNALYFGNLEVARDVARTLGHAAEAAAWDARAAALKTAINTHLFDGTAYLTKRGGGQRIALGAAYAFRFGLVPDAARAKVAAWLREQPAHVGGYGGYTYYQGLYAAGGMGDLAVADLIRYQYMLTGNRTIWESFGRPSPDNETNHAWTAYPAEIFPRRIAGIAPTGPAFSTFTIQPETRGLSFAEAVVPSVRGDIRVRWDRSAAGGLRLRCGIPANTTALLHLPLDGLKDAIVTEGGVELWGKGAVGQSAPGIAFAGADERHVRFTVGSGAYDFAVSGTPVALPALTVIADNDKPAVTLAGAWGNNTRDEVDQRYELSVEQAASGDGSSTATFRPNLPVGGRYRVFARWTSHANRATNAPYTIHHVGGADTVRVNQENNGGKWMLLGEYEFAPGTAGHVVLSNDADEWVVADAVAFSPVRAGVERLGPE